MAKPGGGGDHGQTMAMGEGYWLGRDSMAGGEGYWLGGRGERDIG